MFDELGTQKTIINSDVSFIQFTNSFEKETNILKLHKHL